MTKGSVCSAPLRRCGAGAERRRDRRAARSYYRRCRHRQPTGRRYATVEGTCLGPPLTDRCLLYSAGWPPPPVFQMINTSLACRARSTSPWRHDAVQAHSPRSPSNSNRSLSPPRRPRIVPATEHQPSHHPSGAGDVHGWRRRGSFRTIHTMPGWSPALTLAPAHVRGGTPTRTSSSTEFRCSTPTPEAGGPVSMFNPDVVEARSRVRRLRLSTATNWLPSWWPTTARPRDASLPRSAV